MSVAALVDTDRWPLDSAELHRELSDTFTKENIAILPGFIRENAIADLIAECDGNLDDALILIYMEETGAEPDRGLDLDQLAERCRPVVCADLARTILDILNILTGLFGTIGVALAVLLYILNKYGLEDYCQNNA
jgi:hypothetical protein